MVLASDFGTGPGHALRVGTRAAEVKPARRCVWTRPPPELRHRAMTDTYSTLLIERHANGYAVVTKDNADDFYWEAYLKRRGTKGIEE